MSDLGAQPAPPAAPPNPARGGCIRGAAVAGALLMVGLGGLGWWWHREEQAALALQADKARREFAPALEAMQPQVSGPTYDIDKTMAVIHEIDLALDHSESMDQYLKDMARRDWRGVAPEVIAARRELMDVLFEIYSKQTEMEEQEAMWGVTSELLLATLSVVQVDGDVGPLGGKGSLSVDREQAQKLLDQLQERQDSRMRLGREERELEGRLIEALVKYSETWHQYVDEWDRLCTVRDRAWLATQNRDWANAAVAAQEAIALAPHEKEAHLVLALAQIEGGVVVDAEKGLGADAILGQMIVEHPDSAAPAYLLRGVARARRGETDSALLDLQQASTYYPRQAEALKDRVDPYRMRSWLRMTREGSHVRDLYLTTMLGAGYFSPDLQLARVAFEGGDVAAGRARVLDHFSRRRAQAQWDLLMADISFAENLLGEDYRSIFPEDAWLELQISRSLMGSALSVQVENRSDRDLHNASLVLAIQFTDMHPRDYQTFVAGETQPLVAAHQTTDYGSTEVKYELWGTEKTTEDIVTHRAVLISDEAVVWVDTDEFRLQLSQSEPPPPSVAPSASPRSSVYQQAIDQARREATLSIDKKALVKDGVTITLPKDFAILRPLFRLKYGDQVFDAQENVIVGDEIRLRFDGVEDFEKSGRGDAVELVAHTVLGDVGLTWVPGPGGGSFKLHTSGAGR